MPPLKKIQKQEIIECAFKILVREGLESIHARRLAKELHCSVQPIFHNFSSMEELKKEVLLEAQNIYYNYMQEGSLEPMSYKGMGMAYIRFALDYPNLFKLLFMSESNLSPDNFILKDRAGSRVLQVGQHFTGLSYEEQKKFHLKVWIFTHGLATMLVMKTIVLTFEEIEDLLESTVFELLDGYKKEK